MLEKDKYPPVPDQNVGCNNTVTRRGTGINHVVNLGLLELYIPNMMEFYPSLLVRPPPICMSTHSSTPSLRTDRSPTLVASTSLLQCSLPFYYCPVLI